MNFVAAGMRGVLWFGAAAMLCLAAIPMDSAAQGCAMSVLLGLLWYGRLPAEESSLWRVLTVVVGLFITFRYLVWRAIYTLDAHSASSAVVMYIVFGAEAYSSLLHWLGCTVNIAPMMREDLTLADLPPGTILPSIDVLIPSYNEDAALLEVTLRAALSMRYDPDRLRVVLCDDGGTDQKLADPNPAKAEAARSRRHEMQALCAKLGAVYITRERNEKAKAGNINAALRKVSGDLVVILDADHVPCLDFLDRTVPWLVRDQDVFLVQTPHFMINPDPIDRNLLNAFSRMPSENDMFYMTMQRGLDYWSSSFFCGSAAVLRRSCLDEVGGLGGHSITEDAETALSLHGKGYKSVYVCRPMVAGLAPETFTGFVIQRMRWAQGMVQILLLKKPFMMPGLRWHQRIGYMSSMVFWLFPFARLIFLFAPLAYLVFGLEVYNASIAEIAVYTVPNVIATYLLSNLLFGKTRWPLISGLYEIMQCVFSFRAIIDVLRNPKSPKFVVTPKSETLEAEFISPLAKPFYYILFCLFLGIIGCIYRVWIYPLTRQLTIFVGLWNILNFFVVFVSLGALIERRQRRTSPRMPADEEGVIASTDVAPLTCEIDDLSAHGARACIDPEHVAPAVGSLIDLFVESRPLEREVHLSCRVRSVFAARGKTCIGLQFEPIDERMTTDAVLLAFGDSERWIRFQRRRLRKISYRLALRMILDLAWQPVRAHFVLLWKKKFSFLARRQAEI